MISVTEADKLIADQIKIFSSQTLNLKDSYGAALRESVKADRDLPAASKSLVDGIAISIEYYQKGGRRFPVQGIQPAGVKPPRLSNVQHCFEIMTGAIVPAGCDCVIPVEQVKIENNEAVLPDDLQLKPMQFIRVQAADHRKGDILLKEGSKLGPAQISIAASVGKAKIKVSVLPKIAIISTGDELVDINKPVKSFQVRTSNSYGIQSALAHQGFRDTQIFHIRDDKKILEKKLGGILQKIDVIILSGGVSMGKFDFVPQVLKELGIKVLFHKIRQRPGKPFWFGQSKKGKTVFALPGNPVSTLVCLYRYVLPFLKKSMGLKDIGTEMIALAKGFENKTDLTLFLPVKIDYFAGRLTAHMLEYGGSGDFAGLAPSDGFVELEDALGVFPLGTVVPFYRW